MASSTMAGAPGKGTLDELLFPGRAAAAGHGVPGRAMPGVVQAKMERSFGADFSAVRIHEGPQAQAAGAHAYTQGTDIHFAPGRYDPHGERGQELLGHELAHVVQQSRGRVHATVQAKGLPINDDAGLEHEADEQGARAARGEPAHDGVGASRVAASSAASTAPVQRLKLGNLDTQDGRDRAEIERLLRESTPDRLREIYRALDAEEGVNADYYKQFIQSLWIDRQVQNTPNPGGKVNIVVSIWIDGVPVYETPAWLSGYSADFEQTFEAMDNRPYQRPNKGAEATVSQQDAEPKAFTDAEDTLCSLLNMWQQAIRTVEFVITGNKGACDGCKNRRQLMEQRARDVMRRYPAAQKATLATREIYQEKRLGVPRTSRKFGASSHTDYGRRGDQRYESKTDDKLRRFSDKPLPDHNNEAFGLPEHKADGKVPEWVGYDPRSSAAQLVVRNDYGGAMPDEIAQAVQLGALPFFTSENQAMMAFGSGQLKLEQQFVTVANTPNGFGLYQIKQDKYVATKFYILGVRRGG